LTDLATLVVRVETLEARIGAQNLDDLTTASGRAETATERLTNASRFSTATASQHRMGVQQLGLQFNDFGTQVSAGINPIVAFNQQLGQVGWAMSQMEGRAGAVGAFLAGPWGAAIAIGAAALGALAGRFLDNDDAARRAAEGMEDFRRRQDDIKSFIDETTGALREQNEVLINNAILTREAKLEANAAAADDARRRAFFSASNAGGQFGTFTPGSSGGAQAPTSAAQNEIRAIVQAAGNDVEKLDAGLRALAARRPDLRDTLRVVSDNAAQAVLAARENKRLQDEIDVLSGRTSALSGSNAALIESQVEVATASTQAARAEAQLEQVRRQGRAELQAGTITNEQYRQRLTLATQAVNAARESDRSLAAVRRTAAAEGRREQRESVRDYERLIEQSQRFVDQMGREREEMGLTRIQLIRLNTSRRARELVDTGTAEAVALAGQLVDEAERLIAAINSAEVQVLAPMPRVNLRPLTADQDFMIARTEILADHFREIDRIARRAGDGMADAFGRPGQALSDLMTNLTSYRAEMADIAADEARGAISAAAAARARASAETDMYGDMLSSARGYFAEGSDGYKALLVAEQVYRAFQFASAIQSMALGGQETAMDVANSLAKIGPRLAAGAAGMFEKLGPFGFPAVAAMLALMATLGFSGGGGGGRGGGRSAANDNDPNSATDAVRASDQRESKSREALTASVANSLEVRVTADRDGLNAYVVATARDQAAVVAAPMVAAAAAGTKRDVMQDLRGQHTGNRRNTV
jgi:hypothetical protein